MEAWSGKTASQLELESGSLSRPCSKCLGMLPITWSESLGLLLARQMELVRSVLRFVTERDLAMDASFEPLPVSLGC